MTASITVSRICRYPVKGLSADPLEKVELTPGEGLPGDRRFAIVHGASRFDPMNPEWLPKTNFLMLMRNERLARLQTRFDEADGTLAIFRDGKRVIAGRMSTPVGRAMLEDFFVAFMKEEAQGRVRLVEAPGHMFSDHAEKVVSIINFASVRDLERITAAPVDVLRFRANFCIDGLEPWAEFDWVDREISLGQARLGVTKRTPRCPATEVNPENGTRDIDIVRALKQGFGHADMGVYARVTIAGGAVAEGDPVFPPD